MKKVAIIEPNPFHDQLFPTLVYLLNELGIIPDIYTNINNIKNNVFEYAKDLQFNWRFYIGFYEEKSLKLSKYDLVIFNSLENHKGKEEILLFDKIKNIPVPVIGISHDTHVIPNNEEAISFVKQPNRFLFVIAQHIKDYLRDHKLKSYLIPAIYLGDVSRIPKRETISFAVVGNVNYKRKNYDSLLNAVEQLEKENVCNFKINFIGNNNTPDAYILQDKIREKELEHFFIFSKNNLAYKDYYKEVAQCNFILPLIDDATSKYNRYFECGVTSSIIESFGLEITPVINERLAHLYNIQDSSITYKKDHLYNGLENALQARSIKFIK